MNRDVGAYCIRPLKKDFLPQRHKEHKKKELATENTENTDKKDFIHEWTRM